MATPAEPRQCRRVKRLRCKPSDLDCMGRQGFSEGLVNMTDDAWRPIETAPEYKIGRPLLCRNENHWPEICYIKGGMAFDHRGYAMVGFVAKEWHAGVGRLNYLNAPLPDMPPLPTGEHSPFSSRPADGRAEEKGDEI